MELTTSESNPVKKDEYKRIYIEDLVPGRYQPRKVFDSKSMNELAKSVERIGDVVEPILVRPVEDDDFVYEIIAGERRWRAAELAGLNDIQAIIKTGFSEQEYHSIAIIENIQRKDLNCLEIAEGLKAMVEQYGITHDELAVELGQSRVFITQKIRLLKLPASVQTMLIDERMPEGIARTLLMASSDFEMIQLANQYINLPEDRKWSVRSLEKKLSLQKEATPNKDVNIKKFEEDVTELLGSEVKCNHDKANKKGWLKIRYHSIDDLDRIVERITEHKN